MIEKTVTDSAVKSAQKVEKGVESLVKKAWSVMDAAAEKQRPSQYMSDAGIRAMRGEGG